MTKQEFKEFCHDEFTKRGFRKTKKMYYLKGKDLLCGLYLQKSMSEAYYVEYNFFIGDYNDSKSYPTMYESDVSRRITVLSKDTINGERFMDALIEYEYYTLEELKPYFDRAFDEYIMPPLLYGKKVLLNNKNYYFEPLFPEEVSKVLKKLEC